MQTHEGPGGLILEIDDEDTATPAMVLSPARQFSSTYDCAVAMGALEDEYELSPLQLSWLDQYLDEIETASAHARRPGAGWAGDRA